MMNSKSDARHQIKQRLNTLSQNEREAFNHAIVTRLRTDLSRMPDATTLLVYWPMEEEVDFSVLFAEWIEAGKTLLFPRVENKEELGIYRITDIVNDFCVGPFGIREPSPESCTRISLDAIDVILVPGLAFDRKLNRLGRGGGYYDRLLAGLSARVLLIALCYDCQILDKVPVDCHDKRVHVIMTESTSYRESTISDGGCC